MNVREKQTPGKSLDEAAARLLSLRRLGRLERKEFGEVSDRTRRLIGEALASAEAVCVVEDAKASNWPFPQSVNTERVPATAIVGEASF